MVEKRGFGTGTKILAVIVGAFFGIALHKILGMANVPSTTLFSSNGIDIRSRDIIVLAVGLLLVLFGGRIHRLLRWAGLGVIAWQVGNELAPVIWKE